MRVARNYNLIGRSRGFTLVELLIVILLLSTVAASIIPLYTRAIASNHSSRNKLYAYQGAHAEIERLRSANFDTIENHPFSIPGLSLATGTITVDEEIDGVVQTDIIKVTATVNWTFSGKNEEIKVVTYITEKGINQ